MAMAWVLLIFTTGLLVLLHKKWKKWKKWWLVGIVTALFACSFAATQLGGWAAGLLRALLNLIPGGSGALIAAVLVLLGIPAVIYGFVHDKKADKWEMGVLIALPLLFIIASGPVAAHGGNLTDAVSRFGSSGLGYLVRG